MYYWANQKAVEIYHPITIPKCITPCSASDTQLAFYLSQSKSRIATSHDGWTK